MGIAVIVSGDLAKMKQLRKKAVRKNGMYMQRETAAYKPNPLAGFGEVGCGVFGGGQGADDHRERNISGFGAECKQQKKLCGKKLPVGQEARRH